MKSLCACLCVLLLAASISVPMCVMTEHCPLSMSDCLMIRGEGGDCHERMAQKDRETVYYIASLPLRWERISVNPIMSGGEGLLYADSHPSIDTPPPEAS